MTDISVQNLKKSFEVGHPVLDGLTFEVAAGERVGILGANGCGKTSSASSPASWSPTRARRPYAEAGAWGS